MAVRPAFTLLELLVALLVLGLLAAAVPVVLNRGTAAVSQRTSARELVLGLARARLLAVASGHEVPVMFDLGERRWTVPSAGLRGPLPEGEITMLVTSGEPMQAISIRFFPDGGSTGGTLQFETGASARRIAVDWLTGRIELHD